jgi:hypothetical protein
MLAAIRWLPLRCNPCQIQQNGLPPVPKTLQHTRLKSSGCDFYQCAASDFPILFLVAVLAILAGSAFAAPQSAIQADWLR